MSFIIEKKKTKEDLICDVKLQQYQVIGESAHFLKRRNVLAKIGLYIGRFPVLTPKDVVFLSLAKTKCDILIVALESDLSVRIKKEASLVQYPARERAFLVASLPFVDWVYLYDEEHPELSVQTINPDFIFSGLYSDDEKDIKVFTNRIVKIEHPFELEEKPRKKIPSKFFDLPVE
jgi:bifunctional ADP-heptose synthase (sugar kinase/adenylyltransferase)